MSYDSRPDTWAHIHEVRSRLLQVVSAFQGRAHDHDQSKLTEPELSVFDRVTPQLAKSTYGSDEHKAILEDMGEGLQHHYAVNDHHPEHFDNGIADMGLIQLAEMLADWKAATMRHENGDLGRSIEQNAERFGYGDEIKRLLSNTAAELGWL